MAYLGFLDLKHGLAGSPSTAAGLVMAAKPASGPVLARTPIN